MASIYRGHGKFWKLIYKVVILNSESFMFIYSFIHLFTYLFIYLFIFPLICPSKGKS